MVLATIAPQSGASVGSHPRKRVEERYSEEEVPQSGTKEGSGEEYLLYTRTISLRVCY